MFDSLRSYLAFGLAIPGYARKRLSLDEARGQIKTRLQTRDQRFLEMVDRCIFANPRSPYLPLLQSAGCEFGDLRELVRREGLEPALRQLRSDGVYFTFEEFKGRKPVERSGVAFTLGQGDFDNPAAKHHYSMLTGGSTGSPTRVWLSLDFVEERLAMNLFSRAAHGVLGIPAAACRRGHPSLLVSMIGRARTEGLPEKFFATRFEIGTKDTLKYALARGLIRTAARLGGVKLPKLEWVDPQDGLTIARWAEQTLKSSGRCLINATVSKATRIGIAASENGIDLHGATIMGGSEPPTPAKVREITRMGAKWIPGYTFAEAGRIGEGCANPVDETDLHFLSDKLALIPHPREVPGSDQVVDAFNFTTLSPIAPKVLLNVEIDDFGILERRNCGCPFDEIGFDYHLRQIFSFGKLTGEGVTLVGSDMLRILEEVLPTRLGGSPLDYQLIEEEDESSQTRLSLVIHPRIRIDNETQVLDVILKELESGDGAASMAGKIWTQSGTFRIKRMHPVENSRGKVMPLHLQRRSRSAN